MQDFYRLAAQPVEEFVRISADIEGAHVTHVGRKTGHGLLGKQCRGGIEARQHVYRAGGRS
jgi:hypothetical protein